MEHHFRDLGGKLSLFVTREEDLSAIYFHQHTFAKYFPPLYFCL